MRLCTVHGVAPRPGCDGCYPELLERIAEHSLREELAVAKKLLRFLMDEVVGDRYTGFTEEEARKISELREYLAADEVTR